MVGRLASAYDLVVVGGGIVGMMTAQRYLERFPNKRVLLVEKEYLGAGATVKSGVLASDLVETPELRTWSDESQAYYELIQFTTIRDIYQPLSAYYLYESADRVPNGHTGDQMAGGQFIHKLPSWLARNTGMVAVTGKARYINPQDLITHFARCFARNKSIKVLEQTTVEHIEPFGNDLHLVKAGKELFYANAIAVCTGPWPFDSFGMKGLRNKRIVSFIIDEVPVSSDRVLYFPEEGAFLLPQEDKNQWLLSVTSTQWDVSADDVFDFRSDDWALAFRFANKYLSLEHGAIQPGNVFCDAYSPNKIPVIKHHPTMKRVVYAGGGSGRGVRLAPVIALEALKALDIEVEAPLNKYT